MKARKAQFMLSISIILLLCGCGKPNSHIESDMNNVSSDITIDTSVSDTTETFSDDLSGYDADANTVLPEEAEHALHEYLKCDSTASLANSLYPSSVAEEMKNGNVPLGNYFFAGFPCSAYEDVEILECTRRLQDEVRNLAAFWAMGASLLGVSADFSAEDGYDVVVSAICTVDGEVETMMLRVTNRLTILKITNDRWIIVPSSDVETYNVEIIE